MGKIITIGSYEEFEKFKGKEVGASDYLQVTQSQINQFADATLDHQWIHTNPEKAAVESPFKCTIAHGYLTLSLVPYLWEQIVRFENVKLMVNYGIQDLKFTKAVEVDSHIRLRVFLKDIKNLRGTTKVNLKIAIEIKDSKKPALEAEMVFLYHFKS